MTILNSNKPVWFNKDGGILANGYIWVGEEKKASNNFEVTVTFEDSAGTLTTADQPLRTDDSGRIVYLGTPIIATVDVTHSLLILNSALKQVDYIPSVDAGVVAGTTVTETYNTEADAVADTSLIPGTHVVTLSETTLFSGGGADWVVITFSGTPGDGDLIVDLDNGAQLKKLFNQLNADRNLGEIATAGAAAQLAARENIDIEAGSVAGFTSSQQIYYINDPDPYFNLSGVGTSFTTVGPTGSGATIIIPALDIIPVGAKFVEVLFKLGVTNTSGGLASLIVQAREIGSVETGAQTDAALASINVSGASLTDVTATKLSKLPLDATNKFELKKVVSGTVSLAQLLVKGFGI